MLLFPASNISLKSIINQNTDSENPLCLSFSNVGFSAEVEINI